MKIRWDWENILNKVIIEITNLVIIIIQTIMISMIMRTTEKNPLNQGEKKFDENNTISSHML